MPAPLAVAAVAVSAITVWWFAVPALVIRHDPRLVDRNPTQWKRLVSFFRVGGSMAVLVGCVFAWAL